MENQALYDKEAKKSENLTRKLVALNKKIAEERGILKRHLELAESRGDEFALYEAYWDDEDDDETSSEPQIAQDIWDDAQLGRIQTLVDNKTDLLVSLRNRRIAIENLIRNKTGLLKRISSYNPSVIQSKRHRYLSHFYKVEPKEWLGKNAQVRGNMNSQTNSRLKIVMEMFVRPEYRGLPRPGGKYGQMDLDDIPLTEVPFDPALLSDTFLREFGFAGTFKGNGDLVSLQRKEKLIPAVKRFLEKCFHPLPITPTSKTTEYNYRLLLVKGRGKAHDGKIINPHMDAKHERRIPSVFQSAFDCHRQADHVFTQYQSESKILTETLAELKSLHKRLKGLMGKKVEPGSKEETEKNEIKTGLSEIADDLQNCFNVLKTIAQENIGKAKELKDSLGRENFGAKLAQLIKALASLDGRKEEIFDMSLASPENSIMLENIINVSSGTLQRYDHAFQRYIEEGNMTEFEGLKGTLQELDVRPFNLYAAKLLTSLIRMNTGRYKNDGALRLAEATKALAVTRLFKFQKELEGTLMNLDEERLCSREACKYQIESLFMFIEALQIPHHQQLFNELKHKLEEITARMNEDMADDAEKPSPERSKKLKDALKEIDFEQLLDEII